MLPVVVSPSLDGSIAPIGLSNVELTGARWVMNVTDIAVQKFSVASSGNDIPLTTVQTDWGDGLVEKTDFRPIGRPFQYNHQYDLPGTYAIAVTASNTDGEKSVLNITEIVVQESRKEVTSPTFRWRGLAIPDATIQQTLASITSVVPSEVVSLVETTQVGQNFIVVDSREVLFVPQAQVTITQPGKLITAARVVSSKLNIIRLDSELNDVYDPVSANVEVRSSSISVAMEQRANTDITWAFPSVADTVLVKAAIRMILGTKPFERVMVLDFGSTLHRIPFEQNDLIAESLVRRAVVESIQKWEPRAQVSDFSISHQDNDLNVSLRLVLSQDKQQSFDVNFSLNAQ